MPCSKPLRTRTTGSVTNMHEIVKLIFAAQSGEHISPIRFAQALEEPLSELEKNAGVDPNTARFNPNAETLQLHMRASLLVISALLRLTLDPPTALMRFKYLPLDEFSYLTPQMLVTNGQTIDLLLRLEG
jgi:hypothetical protein